MYIPSSLNLNWLLIYVDLLDVFYLNFPTLFLSPARNTLIDGLVSMWYQSYNQVNHIIATLEKLHKAKLLHQLFNILVELTEI